MWLSKAENEVLTGGVNIASLNGWGVNIASFNRRGVNIILKYNCRGIFIENVGHRANIAYF